MYWEDLKSNTAVKHNNKFEGEIVYGKNFILKYLKNERAHEELKKQQWWRQVKDICVLWLWWRSRS